jgi:hypothetical protein
MFALLVAIEESGCSLEHAVAAAERERSKRAESRVAGSVSGRFAQNNVANRHDGVMAGCGVCSLSIEHFTEQRLVMEHLAALCPKPALGSCRPAACPLFLPLQLTHN